MKRIGKLVLIAFAMGTLAAGNSNAGVDEVYEKTVDRLSWGQILNFFVGNEDFEKSYAFVVGISNYTHYSQLPTENDALRMRDFLVNEAGFDYVHLLTDDKATWGRIHELMVDDFRNRINENDRFLFYWSGHGAQIKVGTGYEGYLPLAGSPKGKLSTMVSMSDLQRWDRLIRARQALFLLDACFSGLAGRASKAPARELTISQLSGPAHHLMTAGTGEEEAIAGDRWGGSLFTAAILEGLGGAADTETVFERDGVVSLNELIAYVKTRIAIEKSNAGWSRSITPQLRDIGSTPNQGEFFFLTNEFKVRKAGGVPAQGQVVIEKGMPLVVLQHPTNKTPPSSGEQLPRSEPSSNGEETFREWWDSRK